MRPGPRAVVDAIVGTLPLESGPRPIDELVRNVILQNPDWQCDPHEMGAAWTSKVHRLLQSQLDTSLREGRQPSYAFNSSSSYMLQGACFEEPGDSEEVAEQKRRRMRWKEYHAALRSLSPGDFEVLCSRVLRLLGVPSPRVTPYRDEGIDFYGSLSFEDLVGSGAIFPTFERHVVIWLLGQAKHYLHSKVATPDIREFVGAIALGRARAFSQAGAYPDLRIRPCDPVIVLFFSTGHISTRGWELCRRAGVVAMDGEMMAAFLADKRVAISSPDGTEVFEPSLFARWLTGE